MSPNDSKYSFLVQYIIDINQAKNFQQCFELLTQAIIQLGFDGVLYSFVPFTMTQKPILWQSANYGDNFLQNYEDKNLFQYDHVVQQAITGKENFISWFDKDDLLKLNDNALAVLKETQKFGIVNGVSFRTFLSAYAYAGVSLVCRKDDAFFHEVCLPNISVLEEVIQYFYLKITSRNYNQKYFLHPLLRDINSTKLAILKGLSTGQNLKKIADNIGRNEKYVRNIASTLPKEFGCKNRDQLMYVAGMLELGEVIQIE